ncbi:glycosyl hydrolase family 18 protein [Cysteiniphilum sp. JM-1]|uniref:glycosyl hydrolase family 18 protein n=1 Tax=Cysteiniphilum sp. JM-1 TaxID=2610891 RepID=UPI0012476D6F|nr:glycosyl hydrolase family 18 protein [Cysteiniphilum sp. JM-1]
MNIKNNFIKLLYSTLTFCFSSALYANTELYQPDKSYTKGCQVIHNGKIYKAKWWANSGDIPDTVVNNAWDTPWELVQVNDKPVNSNMVIDNKENQLYQKIKKEIKPLHFGYLDATATLSASKIQMAKVYSDGYSALIIGFAKIDGVNINYYPGAEEISKIKAKEAKVIGMPVFISVGGAENTFSPGVLDEFQIKQLAQNIVNFLRNQQYDGIDFDLEIKTDPWFLSKLLGEIKSLDDDIILTAAPQFFDNGLVTTGANHDYDIAIKNGYFDYLLVQAYNTENNDFNGGVRGAKYISSLFYKIAAEVPQKTKIAIGEPANAVSAGDATIFHPKPEITLAAIDVSGDIKKEIELIKAHPQYGGVMIWSLNTDYAANLYGDNLVHQPAEIIKKLAK